jgi:predicted O-methyltransferase YrrM
MTASTWAAVDEYFAGRSACLDSVLEQALADSAAAGLPTIHVSSAQGQLLKILAMSVGTRRILEIGTLGGFSTIWLARALPDGGRLVTLEIDPRHAEVARKNIKRAGLDHRVDVRVGPALDLLAGLATENQEHYDFVFIDADKPTIPDYFTWALRLTRPGSLIVVDNVVRQGAIVDTNSSDPSVQGVRQLMDVVSTKSYVTATIIQTVGVKGYDGFLLAHVGAALSATDQTGHRSWRRQQT